MTTASQGRSVHFQTPVLLLVLCFMVYAILLNTVGAVILQVQNSFGVEKVAAATLEAFKDLPVAIASFLLASFLPKIGYKLSIIISLSLVTLACFAMPMADGIWYFRGLFLIVGATFGVVKVIIYASVGILTDNPKDHSSLMSFLEAFFMVGVLLGNVVFSFFIQDDSSTSVYWLQFYPLMGILSLIAVIVAFFIRLDEGKLKTENKTMLEDFSGMIKLMIFPLVIVFVASIFMYVLVEQSISTWTPTYYNQILQIPGSMSIQAGAVLAGAIALGRFLSALLNKYLNWFSVLSISIGLAAVCVFIALPLAQNVQISGDTSWFNAPLAAYVFPLIGLFLAPIYPTINSTMLSSLPVEKHASMSGLIIVFSALGGSTGSMLTGYLFETIGGRQVFYFSVIPMALILVCMYFFKVMSNPRL